MLTELAEEIGHCSGAAEGHCAARKEEQVLPPWGRRCALSRETPGVALKVKETRCAPRGLLSWPDLRGCLRSGGRWAIGDEAYTASRLVEARTRRCPKGRCTWLMRGLCYWMCGCWRG